jgi:WD40 repeat protein
MVPNTPERTRADPARMAPMPDDGRSPRRSSRVKKNPSITPNRFNKFFNPRPKNIKKTSVRSSRKALLSLTSSNLNSRLRASRAAETIDHQDGPPSKKRRLSFSSVPSIPSSPIQAADRAPTSHPRPHLASNVILVDTNDEELETEDEDEPVYSEEEEEEMVSALPRVRHYHNISSATQHLSRQLGRRATYRYGNESKLWQHETANFYSLPGDVLAGENSSRRPRALPFSLASFNHQEAVAIGGEDGDVEIYRVWERMPNYDHSLRLECRMLPHDNAVMDMQFSPDDQFLATASGDQTCRIIDMNTCTGTHTLVGHEGSIKNVRWQPGADNKILATCARDGSVVLWDLRCAAKTLGSLVVKPLIRAPHFLENSREVAPTTEIFGAHSLWDKAKVVNGKRQTVPLSSRVDYTVTACAFISDSRPHLLATTSEHNAMIKVWDMRTSYKQRSGRPTPVSVTAEPVSHELVRPYGVTSMTMSTDSSRLYTLCRDNTVYAYSTAHLVLGGSPEMSSTSTQPFKPSRGAGAGLRPLYGFRHDQLRLGTFYDKLSLRPKTHNHTEMIAVGTGDDCAVLFPTDEKYLTKSNQQPHRASEVPHRPSRQNAQPSVTHRTVSQPRLSASFGSSKSSQAGDVTQDVPIYYHGTPLVNAHKKEVTCCAWVPGNGQLVTVADDYIARCWYEDDPAQARNLRLNLDKDPSRNRSGWASVIEGWDDDEV